MLSFAGIPPLAGFFGKYFIFVNAMNTGYVWLAVVAVVSSVIAAYKYFRVAALVVSHHSEIATVPISTLYRIFLVACIICIVVLGIMLSRYLGYWGSRNTGYCLRHAL